MGAELAAQVGRIVGPGALGVLSTAQKLAQEYKVGEATVKRDEQFAKAVDAIVENCGEGARNLILSRDAGLTRGRVLLLAKTKPAEQKKFIQTLKEEGKPPRRKRRKTKSKSITLPAEPKSLVERLVEQLGEEGAGEVSRLLAERLLQAAER